MNEYLLDTHAYLWFISNDKKLSVSSRKIIEADNKIYISIASLWEITIKASLGKLKLLGPIDDILEKHIEINDLTLLPVLPKHLKILYALPYNHGDPFDRIIIAQSISENLPVIGVDAIFNSYGVNLLS